MKLLLPYLAICLIWGSTWLGIKLGLAGVPPFLGAGLRFLLASLIFFLFVFLRRTPILLGPKGRKSVLSAGILGFTLSYGLIYWAEQYIPSGLTAILFSTMPLAVALLSHWTGAEFLSWGRTLGIAVGMAGTAVLFWTMGPLSASGIWAMGAVLLSSLVSAVNLVLLKRFSREMDVYLLNALGMGIGASILLGCSHFLEGNRGVVWSRENVLALLYLSFFGSVVAFHIYYSLIKTVSATFLSTITLLFPVVAVALGWVVLGERMDLRMACGTILVLAGVGVALRA